MRPKVAADNNRFEFDGHMRAAAFEVVCGDDSLQVPASQCPDQVQAQMPITLDGESVWESRAIVADFQRATTVEDPESDIDLRRAVLGSVRYQLVDNQRERGPL